MNNNNNNFDDFLLFLWVCAFLFLLATAGMFVFKVIAWVWS